MNKPVYDRSCDYMPVLPERVHPIDVPQQEWVRDYRAGIQATDEYDWYGGNDDDEEFIATDEEPADSVKLDQDSVKLESDSE